MKLTGKRLKDSGGAFIEFDVDELPSPEKQEEIVDNQSCYEGIWMGKSTFVDGSFSIMLGFDWMTVEDRELLIDVLDAEDYKEIEGLHEDSRRINL